MTITPPAGQCTIDIGPPDWCWSRLEAAHDGTLSVPSAPGHLSTAVSYAVTDQQIAIPLDPSDAAGWQAAGGVATLEVSGLDEDDRRWVVRATGLATRATLPRPRGGSSSRLTQPARNDRWQPTEPCTRLLMPSVRVRGFYETALDSPAGPLAARRL